MTDTEFQNLLKMMSSELTEDIILGWHTFEQWTDEQFITVCEHRKFNFKSVSDIVYGVEHLTTYFSDSEELAKKFIDKCIKAAEYDKSKQRNYIREIMETS